MHYEIKISAYCKYNKNVIFDFEVKGKNLVMFIENLESGCYLQEWDKQWIDAIKKLFYKCKQEIYAGCKSSHHILKDEEDLLENNEITVTIRKVITLWDF